MASSRVNNALVAHRNTTSNTLRHLGLSGNEQVSATTMRKARQVMLNTQRAVWRDTARIVQANRYDAAAAAVEVHDLAPVLRQAAYEQARAASPTNAQAGATVRSAAGKTTKWLDNLIGDLAASDKTADEIRKAMVDWIDPREPGGLSFAAERLTENELANSFHDAQIATADAQSVEVLRWTLDPGHENEDECDDLAGQEFSPDEVPDLPHVGCLCYLDPVQVAGEEETSVA